MTHQIRRLGPQDVALAAEVVRVFKGSSRSPASLEAFLRNPANYLLVADAEGEAVSFLLAYRLERPDRDAGQMFIYEIDVAESCRRQGLASALLREINAVARDEGMFEAFVMTSENNSAARGLYTRAGGIVEDGSAVLFVYPLDAEGARSAL